MRNAALSLLALIVCSSVFAAGRELTTPVFGPSPLQAFSPVVASDGATFLTAWLGNGGIRGALFDTAGYRITSPDVLLLPVRPTSFDLTSGGDGYVLVWTDATGGHLTFIAADATPLQTIASPKLPNLNGISVASSGTQILVVGRTGDFFPPARIVTCIVNLDGSIAAGPLDVTGFGRVRASWSGKEFLIADGEPTGVFLVRVDAAGLEKIQVKSATGLTSDPGIGTAAAASDGSRVVIVWPEYSHDYVTFWSAALQDGSLISKQSVVMPSPPTGVSTSIVWTGASYISSVANLAVHIDRDGTFVGDFVDVGVPLDELASAKEALYGVGSQPIGTLHGLPLSSVGNLQASAQSFLSLSPTTQGSVSAASDGIDFMAAVAEHTATTHAVTAARVTRDGKTLDGAGIRVGEVTSGGPQTAIAFGASQYAVFWTDYQHIYARRFTATGRAIDAMPILVRSSNSLVSVPAVVWNGTLFFVVWIEGYRVFAATMSADGSVLSISPTRFIDQGSTSFDANPRVAWNGEEFLVIWNNITLCAFECLPTVVGTGGVRVRTDGTPLDSELIQITNDSSGASVASNGRDFLVVLNGPQDLSIVPVSSKGSVGARQSIFRWFSGIESDVAFDGSDYILAWRYPGTTPASSYIATARVSPAGLKSLPVATEAGRPAYTPRIAVTTNRLGDAMTTVTEWQDLTLVRARAYFNWEMQPMPSPPPAPLDVVAIASQFTVTVQWKSASSAAAGIVIEAIRPTGEATVLGTVRADLASVSLQSFGRLSAVRVRAFNIGGMSEPVTVIPRVLVRRRATR